MSEKVNGWPFVIRVAIKAAILFAAINLAFALLDPVPALGTLSAYNVLVPGRPRLPYSDVPDRAYSLSLNDLNAMFASHEIAGGGAPDAYRVLIMGDSSVWGVLLRPEETLAGQINALNLETPGGRPVRAYNLGYPIMSLTKDLLLLERALDYDPDLIVWMLTLRSFAWEEQLYPPLVQANPEPVRRLIAAHDLPLNPGDSRFESRDFAGRTLIGQRRALADWLRLQLYGFAWAATGIDQYYPDPYTPHSVDLEDDEVWQGMEPTDLTADDLAFDVLAAGVEMADDVPVILINEPMFISEGENSDIRYNAFYPRWAYDAYRELLAEQAAANSWTYIDMQDAAPMTEFTDSPVHLTPEGSAILAERVGEAILAQP